MTKTRSQSQRPRQVAVLVDTATQWGRELIRGINTYASQHRIGLSYVRQHAEAFERKVADEETEVQRFNYAHESMASERWMKQRNRLSTWLEQLDKPIAVFCWGTSASSQVMHVCQATGIEVPDEMSVLAGDNDDLIGETTVPTMSAVMTPSAQIGVRAARRLDRLFQGKKDGGKDELPSPIEIVTRGSTEALAIEDAELLAAVRCLREKAFSELTIQAIADSVPMTRRSLERKFSEMIGRTPLAELRRLRIARAKELLATTDLPMPKVASASGFGTPEYMATVFKASTGLTPLRYRSLTRAR
jgi:LacI family transcriptional regulator